MLKSVLKEVIIILLLILAIVLVFSVFLYDYIPMNKVVPKIEAYQVPENVRQEINKEVSEEENTTSTPIVYEINNSDLNLYEKTKDYKKGKVNPFGDISENTVSQNGNTTNNNGTSNGTNTNTNTNSGDGSVTGIK